MRKNKIISNQKRLRICFMQNSQTFFPFIRFFKSYHPAAHHDPAAASQSPFL